jgi:hypothetical protein
LKAWKTLETYQDFFMNVSLSRNWTFHLEDDSRIYLTNFGKSDVSRVWGFCLIPQHRPPCPTRRHVRVNLSTSSLSLSLVLSLIHSCRCIQKLNIQ